jgi:hypothetical protein
MATPLLTLWTPQPPPRPHATQRQTVSFPRHYSADLHWHLPGGEAEVSMLAVIVVTTVDLIGLVALIALAGKIMIG